MKRKQTLHTQPSEWRQKRSKTSIKITYSFSYNVALLLLNELCNAEVVWMAGRISIDGITHKMKVNNFTY